MKYIVTKCIDIGNDNKPEIGIAKLDMMTILNLESVVNQNNLHSATLPVGEMMFFDDYCWRDWILPDGKTDLAMGEALNKLHEKEEFVIIDHEPICHIQSLAVENPIRDIDGNYTTVDAWGYVYWSTWDRYTGDFIRTFGIPIQQLVDIQEAAIKTEWSLEECFKQLRSPSGSVVLTKDQQEEIIKLVNK